jgi:hypothetical protein
MKRFLQRFFLIIGVIVLILVIAAALLFGNELRTLSTLKIADEHPLYTMSYYGDYGFDEFLKVGASSDRDIEAFVTKRLLKGLDIKFNITEAGCTAFTAYNSEGQRIFGRNFDFDYAPALLLHTKPQNGYASLSIVNLSFAGYSADNLPQPMSFNSFLTLAAPYLPFDGINECGVTMALLAVPMAEPPQKSDQITLNTTTAIRLVLDKAKDTEEAVSLLKNYNYYFSGDVECHYLISDASGRSVIVEFLEGDIKVTPNDGGYQAASNFIAYNGLNIGEGYTEFERYDTVMTALEASRGKLSEENAMALLSEVVIPERTQWSAVYNQDNKSVTICMGAHYEKQYQFRMDHFK